MAGPPSLPERLAAWAARRPDAPAVVDGRRSLSYRALLAAAGAAAAELADAGRRGRRAGLVARNDADTVAAVLALTGLGVAPVLVDPRATEDERRSIAELAALREVVSPPPVREAAAAPPGIWRRPSDAFGVTTSGTSGVPKVVGRSWATTLRACSALAEAAGCEPGARVLLTTPLHHAYAFTVLVAALGAGATVVLAPVGTSTAALAAAIAESRPDIVQTVPRLYRALLEAGAVSGPVARVWISAGERLDPGLAAAWQEAAGVGIRNHYGSSEGGAVTLAAPGDVDTVGRPLRGVRVSLRREDGRSEGGGEVCVRAPGRASRYWGQPEETARAFEGGWYRTGDWGELDADGRLTVEGRIDRRIVVAGKKVDPVEVERALLDHPAVRDCVVTQTEEGRARSSFLAFVVADPGAGELDLRRHLAGRLSSYKVPTRLHLVPEVPRTSSGKANLARLTSRA